MFGNVCVTGRNGACTHARNNDNNRLRKMASQKVLLRYFSLKPIVPCLSPLLRSLSENFWKRLRSSQPEEQCWRANRNNSVLDGIGAACALLVNSFFPCVLVRFLSPRLFVRLFVRLSFFLFFSSVSFCNLCGMYYLFMMLPVVFLFDNHATS